MKSIAVYCGSATPADPIYLQAARNVGAVLARRGIAIIYGGGRLGLMGALADAALDLGGKVIGVIPEALKRPEVANHRCTELHVVASMHERKQRFSDLSDAFLTLPGGVGTMDELWEAVSWAQLGYHNKPVGLLNIAGYYDALARFYGDMIGVGFVREQHRGILLIDTVLEPLLTRMAAYRAHMPIFDMTADEL